MKRRAFIPALICLIFQIQAFSETVQAYPVDGEFSYPVEITQTEVSDSSDGGMFGPTSYVQLGGGLNLWKGYEPYWGYGQVFFLMDGGKWTYDAAARASYESFDLEMQLVFWPLKFKHLRGGLGLMYGLNFFGNTSFTNSLLPGLYLQFRTEKIFHMNLFLNYMIKLRTIHSLSDEFPCLVNQSLGVGFSFGFNLPANFGLDFSLASYGPFRISLLGSPSLSVDLSYTMGKWRFSLGAVATFIDTFTLSAYLYDVEVQAGARYTFGKEKR